MGIEPLKTARLSGWLAALAVSIWVFLYLVLNNITDWDLWGVMSFGALLDQNPGFFPYTDPFSYTAPGKPWIYHEWGSGVIFYQVFKHWGSAALFGLKWLLVEGMLLLACQPQWSCRPSPFPDSRMRQALCSLLLILSAYLILPIVSTTIRCQLFTFVGYALTLALLERHRLQEASRCIWLLPALMVLWVNLHGGFIVGLVALASYALHHRLSGQYKQAQQLVIVLTLCALATLMNPYGVAFLLTMFSAWSLPRTDISEWGNVFSLHIPGYGLLYSVLLLGWFGLGIRAFQQKAWYALLLITFTGGYGWLHYKLAPLFLISLLSSGHYFLPLGKAKLTPSWKMITANLYTIVAYALPILLIVAGGICGLLYFQNTDQPFAVRVQGADTIRPDQPATRSAYPIGAARFITENHISGNFWVPFSWGEFLYWTLYPNGRVSMDGRYETIYPPAVYTDYLAFYKPPFDISRAERYPTTHILIDAYSRTLVRKLSQSGRWHEIYRDSRTILFAKQARPTATVMTDERSRPLDDYRGDLSRFHLTETTR